MNIQTKTTAVWLAVSLWAANPGFSQNIVKLSLVDAVNKGLANSKDLKLSQSKVDEAVAKFKQSKDAHLPDAKASLMYNHAFILNNQLAFPGLPALTLPSNADVFLGIASVNQVVFGGLRYKYAQQSAEILKKVSELDVERQKDEIIYGVVSAYYNLYKLKQSGKIVKQNYLEIAERLAETEKLEKQGLATQNDILKWKLQKSNFDITEMEIKANLKVINYNLNILLGLPEDAQIETDTVFIIENKNLPLDEYIKTAFLNREELQIEEYRQKQADLNIKSVNGGKYPTLSVGGSFYYINPTAKIVPQANTFANIATLAATASYDIGTLYKNGHKSEEAKVKKMQADISRSRAEDEIKKEVVREYENYMRLQEKTKLISVTIDQAQENYRMVTSRYKNNVASTADKIDAETMLFESQINYELSKADAQVAYYSLLKSIGTLTNLNTTNN